MTTIQSWYMGVACICECTHGYMCIYMNDECSSVDNNESNGFLHVSKHSVKQIIIAVYSCVIWSSIKLFGV